MPQNWSTRRSLVLVAAVVALTCAVSVVALGMSDPEPVASTGLGPDWQCTRLAFIFTTCSRVKNTQAAPAVYVAKAAACTRLRT